MNAFLARSFISILSLFVLDAIGRAENWPQWRGPNNDGVSQEKGLPTSWGPTQNVAWSLPLPGIGSSTPCVWGNRLFLTSEDNGELVLLCASTSGKQLWKRVLGKSDKRYRKDEGNDASPSPSVDGKHVYAFVGSGNLACFDLEGKEIWKFDVQQRYGKFQIQFGLHSTPVLYGDRLYLALLHDGGQSVIALDKSNGKQVWKVERKSDGRAECLHSYASPMIWHNGDKAYLIVHGNDYTTAHSLKDGAEVWRVGDLNPKSSYNSTLRFVSTPLCTPDLIVIPTAKRGQVVAIKPDAKGDLTHSGSELWRLPKGTPDVPSPLWHDGLVYLCGEQGNLQCLDAASGKVYYDERIHNYRHRASPVYVDGKIVCVARDGVATVVEPGKEFKLLATNRLDDNITASPAISGGRLYLRGWSKLYAIGNTQSGN